MTTTQDPIAHAARLLREAAEELRQAHAFPGSEGWENETDAKAAYDEHMAAAQALEDWEAAVGAGGVQALSAAPPALPPYPPLPMQFACSGVFAVYSADQMRAYVDADRAARAPADSVAAPAIGDELRDTLVAVSAAIAERDDRAAQKMICEILAASTTPPAEQQATKETSGGFHVWRDISTAPKDGSRFVATGHNYGLYSEVRHICVAQWFRGCWVETSDWNETSELKYLTHWMPLPSPPDDVAAPAEQQAQPDECFPGEPKVAVPQGLISAACFAIRKKRDGGKVLEQLRRYSVGDRSQPLAPQQAAPKAAPGDALDEALRERDDAEDFIDATLDEVLGHERPEWSSSYGRADALNDVQERMTALHKPAVDKAWGRFQSALAEPQQEAPKAAPGEPDPADIIAGALQISRGHAIEMMREALEAAPQQEAQEPCPTCVAMARTVMLDQVSFDRKPDCYGIRQITDDESVEEWEDIRTSPDVAREEANDMMETGRGEIYEVVPLYTTPQPAPALLSDDAKDVVRDAAFEAVRKKLCALPRFSFLSDGYGVRRVPDKSGSWIAFDAAHELFDPVAVDAALAAQGGQ